MPVKGANRFTLPAGDMKQELASGMSFDADEMALKTNARNAMASRGRCNLLICKEPGKCWHGCC